MKRSQQMDLFAPRPDEDDELDFFQQKAEPRPRPVLTAVPASATVPAVDTAPPAPPTKLKPKARTILVPFGTRPHEAAHLIAEAAADAWHRHHGGSRMEIPVGVVAALSLWPLKGPDAPKQADWMLGLDTKDLVQMMRECWAHWWMCRPDLVQRAAPIATWTEEPLGKHELACVKAVAHAAITNGLLDLTGSSDPYDHAEFDLMSWMITGLRSRGATKGLGEYHTPPEIISSPQQISGT
ncbi:hypothetical protein [Kitasatospora sp. NPDC058478]|uniref:hypothetical protein n=1 Tax=unclassified Kitasatospora TaxID=2633591 RepID=UPI00365FC0F2